MLKKSRTAGIMPETRLQGPILRAGGLASPARYVQPCLWECGASGPHFRKFRSGGQGPGQSPECPEFLGPKSFRVKIVPMTHHYLNVAATPRMALSHRNLL